MWQKIKNSVLSLLCAFCAVVLLCKSQTASAGAIRGLILCGEVIIPSLFIFSVLGIFIVSSNCFNNISNFISPISKFIFGLDGELFTVFLVSLFSGYPVGAKLIDDLSGRKIIDEKTANTMLYYCVNAGPAFVVITVGEKVFGSKILGYILLASHILSSLIFASLMKKHIKKGKSKKSNEPVCLSDAFVNSVCDAAQSIINICAFVILFSVICEMPKSEYFKFITPFFEVTTGIIATKNIYLTAFLLGFGGLSVQLQVLAVSQNFKVNKLRFFLSRILHGGLSVLLTYIIIKIFKITLPVISNNQTFSCSVSSLSVYASVCFICSAVVFVSTVKIKKVSTKN